MDGAPVEGGELDAVMGYADEEDDIFQALHPGVGNSDAAADPRRPFRFPLLDGGKKRFLVRELLGLGDVPHDLREDRALVTGLEIGRDHIRNDQARRLYHGIALHAIPDDGISPRLANG